MIILIIILIIARIEIIDVITTQMRIAILLKIWAVYFVKGYFIPELKSSIFIKTFYFPSLHP